MRHHVALVLSKQAPPEPVAVDAVVVAALLPRLVIGTVAQRGRLRNAQAVSGGDDL